MQIPTTICSKSVAYRNAFPRPRKYKAFYTFICVFIVYESSYIQILPLLCNPISITFALCMCKALKTIRVNNIKFNHFMDGK